MEEQILRQIELGNINPQLVREVHNYLKPVFDQKSISKLKDSCGKKICNFILRLLKLCRDQIESSRCSSDVVEIILNGCQGLQTLGYGNHDDRIVVGKVLHFLIVSMISKASILTPTLTVCQCLLDFLILIDEKGHLSDLETNSPIAKNTWSYLWNAFISRQKSGVKTGEDDYRILSFALRFYALIAEPCALFGKFYAVVQKDLNASETDGAAMVWIVDMSTDLVMMLLGKFESMARNDISEVTCNIASIALCLTLNCKNIEKFKEILIIVDKLKSVDVCLNLFSCWYSKSMDTAMLNDLGPMTENSMLCVTESLNSVLRQGSENQCFEIQFFKYARREFDYLKVCNDGDKKLRAVVVASKICTQRLAKLTKAFGAKNVKIFTELETEIEELKSVLLEAIPLSSKSFFTKKLHELAYSVIRAGQELKKTNLSEAIKFYEKGVEIIEMWAERMNREKDELWSFYYELSFMYYAQTEYEKCLSLLENVVICNRKNLKDIAAMYVKCKMTGDLLKSARFLAMKLPETNQDYITVLKSEYSAWTKYKVAQVGCVMAEILETLLSAETNPIEHGRLVLEKAILLWSTTDYKAALNLVDESLAIVGDVGGMNEIVLARAYLWKYVIYKSTLQSKYRIEHKLEDTDYKNDINDFNDKLETDKSSLKFKDSFTLKEEHNIDNVLVKSLEIIEKLTVDELPPELVSDIGMLYGMFLLNGSFELSLRTASIQDNDSSKLNQAESYLEMMQFHKALSVLESCNEKVSAEWRIVKSKALLCVGKIQEGYSVLEPLNSERSEMSTRLVGQLTALMAEYHRLPLDILGAKVGLNGENSNPLFLSTFSFQCSQQAFNKASGLEADKFGNLPEIPDDKNLALPNLMTQFSILNDLLSGLINVSRRHWEVGESKYAKTYLQDALTLSLRFCLPKWTSRILIESAKLGLMEGRILQSEEKLQRAHWILNFEFMEMSPKTDVKQDAPEQVEVVEEVEDQQECRAKHLMSEFGFDEDTDDFIQTKCLKTSVALAKHESRALAGYEHAVLAPASRSEACRICRTECLLYRDLSLARLSISILTVQSECFLHGGTADGVKAVDQSLNTSMADYTKRFPDVAFKDLVSEHRMTLAKSTSDSVGFNELVENLRFASNPDLIRCFQLLAEAYYYLGVKSLESHFVKPTVCRQENLPAKKSLMDQLCNDDENEEFQCEMQKEAKQMKAVNEKPISKNGRRKRRPVKPDTDAGIIEIKLLADRDEGLMLTPDDRVSNVHIVRKTGSRPIKAPTSDGCTTPALENPAKRGSVRGSKPGQGNVDENLKRKVTKTRKTVGKSTVESEPIVLDNSPCSGNTEVMIGQQPPNAPKRGRKPRKNLRDSDDLERKVGSAVPVQCISSVEKPISIFTDDGDSPVSVASEDLGKLFDEMSLDESMETSRITKTNSSASRTSVRTKKVSDPTNPVVKPRKTRTRKNAVAEDTPKPATQRRTRASKKDNVENLRGSDYEDKCLVEMDSLIGDFKEESLTKLESFRLHVNADDDRFFPEIESLRGPTRPAAGSGRRKILGNLSSISNTPPSTDSPILVVNRRRATPNDNTGIGRLEEAFKLLRHHPVSSLYRSVCQALGVLMCGEDPWLSAYYFNEAACVAYRHEAVLALQKKRAQKRQMKSVNETEDTDRQVETAICFPKDLQHFRTMISLLPVDWTIVIVSVVTSPLSSTNHMYITRLRGKETPLTVACPGFLVHGQNLIETFEETICDSRMRNSECEDRVRWWTAKRIYSSNVEKIVEKLENDVLSHYKGLLLGLYANSDISAMAKQKSMEMLSTFKTNSELRDSDLLNVILQSLSYLNEEQLNSSVIDIFPDCNDVEIQEIKCQMRTFKTMYPMTGKREPVILILDKLISHFPFENMPILSENSVVRSLSVYSLHCQLLLNACGQEDGLKITGPDMSNISYILDPEYNLPNTRQQFADWFCQLGWTGSVGKKPSREEFEQHLTHSDMMLYLGHGSGQRYVDGTRIQKLCCRAAVVLMGCSSGALKINGQMEPRGMILNYIMARSPFVMGNLWDVTDGDIDRFTKALLEYWLSSEPGTKLHTAIQHARAACRLRYLTGSAPVMYGLPL